MKARILTAILGIPLVILAVWWGYIPLFLLTLIISILGLLEFFNLAQIRNYRPQKITGLLANISLGVTIFLKRQQDLYIFPLITLIILVSLVVALCKKDFRGGIASLGVTLLGIFYTGWLIFHINMLRELAPGGRELSFFLFITTWMIDISAFYIGTYFGKHKVFPQVSPHKSLEGCCAGLVFGIGTCFLLKFCFKVSFISYLQCLVIGLILGIGGLAGDLVESFFKRNAGVKDSSNILPGHGGILDRFDSLLFNAPLFYYYLIFFVFK